MLINSYPPLPVRNTLLCPMVTSKKLRCITL